MILKNSTGKLPGWLRAWRGGQYSFSQVKVLWLDLYYIFRN